MKRAHREILGHRGRRERLATRTAFPEALEARVLMSASPRRNAPTFASWVEAAPSETATTTSGVPAEIQARQQSDVTKWAPAGAFAIPGVAGTQTRLAFTLVQREAAYRNEVGLFLVDGARGRIGRLMPGDPGYARAALGRRVVLFPQGHKVGDTASVEMPAGRHFGTYLIADGTSERWLTRSLDRGRGAVYFSFPSANADRFAHVRRSQDAILAFEDRWAGGDRDFNDAVVRVGVGISPDVLSPTVTIQQPPNGTLTNRNIVVAGVVADDRSGVARVEIRIDGAAAENVAFDAQGRFQLATTFATDGTADGNHVIEVRAIDGAGLVSEPARLAFRLDTIAPVAPTVDLDPGSDSAPVGDGETTFGVVRLVGITEPAATVSLGGTGRTTTADAAGKYAFDGVSLALGANSFTVSASDVAGNARTTSRAFTRASVGPTPLIQAGLARDTAPNGATNSDRLTSDPTISGTVLSDRAPASLLASFTGTSPADLVDVSAALVPGGTFVLDRATLARVNGGTLPDGPYTLRLVASDDLGATSAAAAIAFTLDTAEPLAPAFDLDPTTDTAPTGDGQTSFTAVTLRGQTENGSVVVLSGRSQSTTADAQGAFTLPGVNLELGPNPLTLRAMDAAGNESTFTRSIVRFDASPSLFADPDLEAAVRSTLGLPAVQVITVSDLAALKQLHADSNLVESLVGLEYATNLEALELTPSEFGVDGQLSDVVPLAGLMKLASLTLVRAGLSDLELSALSGLSSLGSLDLRYNQLTSVSFVANLPDLAVLRLHGNQILNASALKGKLIHTDLEPYELDKAVTIAEVAAALHYLPLDLYEYVRNRIRYEPYTGAMRGVQAVLERSAGNEWDQASVLVGLFRESGVQAGYSRGRVRATRSDVQSWLGVRNLSAARHILDELGLNASTFSNAQGETIGLEFDHTWVNATLAVPGGTTQSVAFDPSWKLQDLPDEVPNLASVPFDKTGYLAKVTDQLPDDFYANQVAVHLAQTGSDVSIGTLPSIRQAKITGIPPGLPYEVVSQINSFASVPDSFKHRVTFTIQGADAGDDSTGDFGISYTIRTADVGAVPIFVDWDRTNPSEVRPVLRVGAERIVAPYAVLPATQFVRIRYDAAGPGITSGSATGASSPIPIGNFISVTVDAGQASTASLSRLQSRAAQSGQTSPTSPEATLDLLAVLGATYTSNLAEGLDHVARITQFVSPVNRLGFTFTSATPQSSIASGLPYPQTSTGFIIDSRAFRAPSYISAGSVFDTLAVPAITVGIQASANEHYAIEEVTNLAGFSTVRAFQAANEQGIRIVELTPFGNQSVIDNLPIDEREKRRIREALAKGNSIRLPEQIVRYGKNGELTGVAFEDIPPSGAGREGYIVVTPCYAGGGCGSGDPSDPDAIEEGNNPKQPQAGDPVNIANGNVTRDETDFAIPNIGVPLAFARHYDSQSDADLGLGRGWTHTYADKLTIPGDGSVTWTNDVGYRLRFTPDGSGGYTSPNTLFGRLRAAGGVYEYRDRDGSVRSFDAQGRLVALRDRNGNGLTVTREGDGRIASVSDLFDASRRLTFGYTGNNIGSVSDFTGRTWTFAYDGAGRLASVTTPGDAATPPAVTRYAYHESAPIAGYLRQITEPNGGTTSYTYYPNGRAFQVTDAEGFTHSFSYDLYHNRTTFTDERGNPTVYVYNADGNLIELVHPDGATERYVWSNQLLRSHIDAFGVAETYDEYDALGNVIRMTDRAGIVTTYAYYTEFSNLSRVTRPGGRATTFRYDTGGNLERIEDAEGNVTLLAPDSRGLIRSRTEPRGVLTPQPGDFTTTYAYNAAGQVISATTDLPSTTIWDYDPRGNLRLVTDANGLSTSYDYDPRDRLKTLTDATGKFSTYAYDTIGNQTSTTDRLGRTTRTDYDLRRLPVRITNPDGTLATFSYDAAMNMVAAVDEQGHATRLVHDENNRAIWRIQADGGATAMRYDGGGRLVASVDPLGNATRYGYDRAGRLVTTTDALNHSVAYAYDTVVGNLRTVTDRLGGTTTYTYDRLDRVRKVEGPEGYLATTDYDANGNLTATATYDVKGLAQVPDDPTTLPAERRHSYVTTYDVLDRPTHWTNPRGEFREVVYDAGSRVRLAYDELRNETKFDYDALNRVSLVTNARQEKETRGYDLEGNLTSITNDLGQVTGFTYDSRDRRRTEQLDLGQTSRYAYDAAGNLVAATDALGNTTRYGYDAVNRPTRTEKPTGAVTLQEYDLAGNLVAIVDPARNRTSYGYDALNRLKTDTDQLGFARTYTYDSEGNLATSTDRDGRMRKFSYNGLDQNTKEEWLDASASVVYTAIYSFDGFHRMETAVDAASNYRYGYDEVDRIRSVDNAGTPGVPSVQLAYGYDDAGNRKTVDTTVAGRASSTETRTFDELNRVERITQVGDGLASKRVDFTYDRAGRPETIGPYADLEGTTSVATTTYGYDDNGWLKTLVYARGTTPIGSYGFAYDDAGRLKLLTSPDGTSEYSCDGSGQVLGADNSARADESYAYDLAGNRSTAGYATDPGNRLRSDGRYTYAYDREGNRTGRTETATGEATTYAYDHRGRLVGVETRGAAAVVLMRASYAYDVFDRRIAKTVDADGDGPVGAVVGRFVHDGDAIALEFDGAGRLAHRYLNGPAVDQILADEDASGDVLWPLTDHLGTVRDLIDSSGMVAEHRAYDAFGNIVSRTGGPVDHAFGFTGRELDAETGLHFYRSRYYDAAVGRFLGQDRIGFAAGDPNLYRYVGNSPTNFTDPYGFDSLNSSMTEAVNWLNQRAENAFIDAISSGLGDAVTMLHDFARDWGLPAVQYGAPAVGALAAARAGVLGRFLAGMGLQFGIEELANYLVFDELTNAIKVKYNVTDKVAARVANDIITMAGILGGVAGTASSRPGRVGRAASNNGPTTRPGQLASAYPEGRPVGGRREGSRPTDPPAGLRESGAWDLTNDNLGLMERGRPPIGRDGLPIELHHRNQDPRGPLDEYTSSTHDTIPHPIRPSQIDRAAFAGERSRYWVSRARELLGQ